MEFTITMDKRILRIVIVSFFAAVICVAGFFRVPLPGLQTGVVLQNAMCVLTAILIGGVYGAAPSALFTLVGLLGVPIFAGWIGGFALLANVNGGYRIGFVFGALVAGLLSGRSSVDERSVSAARVARISAAALSGMLALYIPEIFYVLAFYSGQTYSEAVVQKLGMDAALVGQEVGAAGALKVFAGMFFLPFLPLDLVKTVAVVLLSLKIRPVVAQYFHD